MDESLRAIDAVPDSVVRDRLKGEWLVEACEAPDAPMELRAQAREFFSKRRLDLRLARILARESSVALAAGDIHRGTKFAKEAADRLSHTAGAPLIANVSALSRVSDALAESSARAVQDDVVRGVSPASDLLLADFVRDFAVNHDARPTPEAFQHWMAQLREGRVVVFIARRPGGLLRATIRRSGIAISQVAVNTNQLSVLVRDASRSVSAGCLTDPTLKRLSALLWDEPTMDLERAREVIFVPDGDLNDVPFSALISSRDGTPLVEFVAVAVAPSLGRLIRRGSRSLEVNSLAIVAPPSDLVAAQEEVSMLRNLWPFQVTKTPSTAAGVLRALESRSILHISGHAIVFGRPGFERLEFGPSTGDASSSLATAELWGAHISAPLVVLATCSSGSGVAGRQGVATSIANAMVSSGAGAVLATLWNVTDSEMTSGVLSFYRSLVRSGDLMSAVRSAQLEMRRAGGAEWAAIALVL